MNTFHEESKDDPRYSLPYSLAVETQGIRFLLEVCERLPRTAAEITVDDIKDAMIDQQNYVLEKWRAPDDYWPNRYEALGPDIRLLFGDAAENFAAFLFLRSAIRRLRRQRGEAASFPVRSDGDLDRYIGVAPTPRSGLYFHLCCRNDETTAVLELILLPELMDFIGETLIDRIERKGTAVIDETDMRSAIEELFECQRSERRGMHTVRGVGWVSYPMMRAGNLSAVDWTLILDAFEARIAQALRTIYPLWMACSRPIDG